MQTGSRASVLASGVERQEPQTLPSLLMRDMLQPRARTHAPCCFSRLKKLPSKVLDDTDDDDLSTDGGSLHEAPLSYTFPRDSTATSQI